MELSWSTFLIEIVNFAILMWLLTRFLYQPVLRAIEARRTAISQEMQRAQALQHSAQEQAERYASRLADWEREKAQLKDAFDRDLDAERERREADLARDLQQERDRAAAEAKAHAREQAEVLRAQADRSAAQFVADILDRVASAELERRLIDATLEDLRALSDAHRRTIARAFEGRPEAVVTTRYPLDEAHRDAITDALATCLGKAPALRVAQDDGLVAGIRIDLGSITLQGNLAGELAWFARAHGNGHI